MPQMRRIAGRAGICLWMLVLMAAPQARGANSEGIYSNVCLETETQDQGGIELQLKLADGRPTVLFKTCEGGCRQQPTIGVVLRGNRLVFSASDQDFTSDGTLAHTTVHVIRGTLRGDAMVIESPGYLPLQQLKRQRLPPSTTRRAGTATGSNPSAWPIPVRRCR